MDLKENGLDANDELKALDEMLTDEEDTLTDTSFTKDAKEDKKQFNAQ